MAKYYVQSGNFRSLVSADDAEKAALWIVHKVIQQVLPVDDDLELDPTQKGQAVIAHGIMVLGNQIVVSEQGYCGDDSQFFDTFDLLTHWHQLMLALDRLAELVSPQSEVDTLLCGS
jgi:hypothetical protein